MQIGSDIDKALIDAVDMDILLGDIAEIDSIDDGGDALVFGHPRDGDDIADFGPVPPFVFPDLLLRFEKAGTGGVPASRNSYCRNEMPPCRGLSL